MRASSRVSMQLSAEELRNEFAFVGGDVKRVERYRKASRPGATPNQSAAADTAQAALEAEPRVHSPDALRAGTSAENEDAEGRELASAIAALATKKAALAARKRALAHHSNLADNARGGLHTQLEIEAEPELAVPSAKVRVACPCSIRVLALRAHLAFGMSQRHSCT